MGKRQRELDPRGFTYDTGWKQADANHELSDPDPANDPPDTLASTDARSQEVREQVQRRMAEWRRSHSIEMVRNHYASPLPGLTVIEQATGGCLDSISAAIAGFKHRGGTEDMSTTLGRAKATCELGCAGNDRCGHRHGDKARPDQGRC